MTVDRRWRDATPVTTSRRLNRVPKQNCGKCLSFGYMDVYATHVQWECGCTHELPPLPSVRCAGIPRKGD